MTDVTPANASFPSKISPTPTKPEEAGRIGRSSLARSQSSSSGHSGSEALGTRTPSKTQGGRNTLNQMGHAPQPPGGKQSGVRKVNSESDLKVKERARVPHFSRGEGTRGYVQTRGGGRGRQKWLYRSPEFSKGDSRRRIRLLLAVLAGDLVPDRLEGRTCRNNTDV